MKYQSSLARGQVAYKSGGHFQHSTRQGKHRERNSATIKYTRSNTYQLRSRTQQRIINNSNRTNEATTTKKRIKGAKNTVSYPDEINQDPIDTHGDPVTKIKERTKYIPSGLQKKLKIYVVIVICYLINPNIL